MDLEAAKAKLENKSLYEDIGTREILSRSLILEQQTSSDQLRRLRIEQEVVGASADIQEKKVRNVQRKNQKQIK